MTDLDPRSRDLVIRTVLGEAANESDEGLAAVAAVIRNRAESGRYGSIPRVVLAPNQFEPWSTAQGRQRMLSYAPDSEPYKRAAAATDAVFQRGEDPTQGAIHFFSPTAQAQLGRNPPSWAKGESLAIGRHNFYAPEGRVTVNGPKEVMDADVLARFQQASSQPQEVTDPDVLARFTGGQQQNPVADRFPERQQNEALQGQLQRTARDMTTGAPTSQGTKIGIDFANSQAAAGQRTTPNIEAQYKNLVSAETFEDETGNVLYRDPTSGKVLPTDKNKHVALTDPADGRVKVFARTDDTNEGMLSAGGRLLMSGMGAGAATARPAAGAVAALRPGQEVTLAADRLGVQVPKAVATDSTAVQRIGATTRNIPLAGDPLVKSAERTLTQIGSKADEVAQGYGGGTVVGAGDAAKGAISQYITGKTAETADKLYKAVDGLVDAGVTRELSATRGTIANIAAEKSAAGLPPGKAVGTVLDAVQRPGGLTYEGTKTLRTAIGEDLKRGILPEGMSQGDLKRIYGALTDDLKSVVGEAGGAKASAAFERANRYYNLASERNSQLAKIVGASADAPAEQVFERLVAKASSSARGDVEALVKARKAIGAEGWNEFASGVVSKLGRDVEGNFSPQRFLTDYGKLSETGKAILFKSGGNSGLAHSLDDIAKVSSRFKELQKFANPSGTSQSVMGGGIAAGMLADPLTTIGTVVGGRALAMILARPSTAASVSKWSRSYEQLARNPSTPRLAMLEMASRNLVTNLKDVGVSVSPKDFLKALQGPMPARSENEQP